MANWNRSDTSCQACSVVWASLAFGTFFGTRWVIEIDQQSRLTLGSFFGLILARSALIRTMHVHACFSTRRCEHPLLDGYSQYTVPVIVHRCPVAHVVRYACQWPRGQGSRSMHARKMHMERICLYSGLIWVRYLQCVPGSRYLFNLVSMTSWRSRCSGGKSVELDELRRNL